MQIEEKFTLMVGAELHSSHTSDELSRGLVLAEDGFVVWGPYMRLAAGVWVIHFVGDLSDPRECFIEVVSSHGRVCHSTKPCDQELGFTEVEFSTPLEQVEFRLFCKAGSELRLSRVVISRSHSSNVAAFPMADFGRSFEIYPRMGLRLLLDRTSFVDEVLISTKVWEEPQLNRLKDAILSVAMVTKKKIFFDVGAYFGLYSMILERLGLLDRILTFEADAFNFRQLGANLLLNDPACRIEPHFGAVTDHDGEGRFPSSLDHPTGNRGGVGVADGTGNFAVKAIRLDTLYDFRDQLLFFKIDVEGHEIEVLNGMNTLLALNRCYLQIEGLEGAVDLMKYMGDRGFKYLGSIELDHYFSNYDPTSL